MSYLHKSVILKGQLGHAHEKNIPDFSLAATSLLLLFVPVTTQAEQAPAAPQIEAKAWILMDYSSGKVLAESNADQRLDPASLTKMMTSYVVGQALKSGKITSNDMVTIGQDAWATGNPKLRGSSLMFLKPGDRIPVSELNKGVVIQSGNDACIALADYVAGSQDAFIGLMNNYAKSLWPAKHPLHDGARSGRRRPVQHRTRHGDHRPAPDW
ncbi:hypothetical protein E05_09920 [Plautia stali symbiont]|nr:hypothetical protein E05_09920 [Plautia stali symbiont]